MDGCIYEEDKGDDGTTICWTVVSGDNCISSYASFQLLLINISCGSVLMCLTGMAALTDIFLKCCDIEEATNRPHRKADDPAGVHVSALALLTCKTLEGKELSHMFCHEGHVSRTLLLFREILAGRAPLAEVSSAGMTRHTPTSKTRQGGH